MRTYADGVLVSTDGPPLRMRVAREFVYAGVIAFDLASLARVERHVFVDASARSIRHLIIVHFEAFRAGVDDHYRYALTDERTLGGAIYGRSADWLSVAAERNEAPKGEMARTDAFLRGKGFALPDSHAVARYARIVGDDRRRELLIFYHDCEGGLDGIHDRAERAFDLLAGPVQSSQ